MQISVEGDLHQGICDHGEDCCPHDVNGKITECFGNLYSNGKKVVTVGDRVTHNCPHCGKGEISSSTGTIYIKGKQVCGIGSSIKYEGGTGKITSAKGNIYNG